MKYEVNVFRKKRFADYTPDGKVLAIYEDETDGLLIGTYERGSARAITKLLPNEQRRFDVYSHDGNEFMITVSNFDTQSMTLEKDVLHLLKSLVDYCGMLSTNWTEVFDIRFNGKKNRLFVSIPFLARFEESLKYYFAAMTGTERYKNLVTCEEDAMLWQYLANRVDLVNSGFYDYVDKFGLRGEDVEVDSDGDPIDPVKCYYHDNLVQYTNTTHYKTPPLPLEECINYVSALTEWAYKYYDVDDYHVNYVPYGEYYVGIISVDIDDETDIDEDWAEFDIDYWLGRKE